MNNKHYINGLELIVILLIIAIAVLRNDQLISIKPYFLIGLLSFLIIRPMTKFVGKYWMKLAAFFSKLASPIILAVFYFSIFGVISLFYRLTNKSKNNDSSFVLKLDKTNFEKMW